MLTGKRATGSKTKQAALLPKRAGLLTKRAALLTQRSLTVEEEAHEQELG